MASWHPKHTNELDTLIYVLSHDFRGPARAMRQYCTLLEKELEASESNDRVGHLVSRLYQVLDDLDGRLDGLLELSRIDQPKSEPLAIDIQALFSRLLSERNLTGGTDGVLPRVHGHHQLVERILAELLDNVCHHAGADATVSLRAEIDRFCVSDNGCGIPDNIREEAFVVFRPIAPHDSPRRGLGLNICQRIVQTWGGAIGLGDPGKEGTHVFFTLPIQQNG
jgi:signal transduction histidine kinase